MTGVQTCALPICLRAKLGRLSNTVRTVRGQGYRFYRHPEVVVWAAPEYSI